MRSTMGGTKRISVYLFFMLACTLALAMGCGRVLDGRPSGGCTNNAAPADSVIIAPTNLGAPSVNGSSCYPALPFTVTASDGTPLNNVCIEIFSNAAIALHSGAPDCSKVSANPQTSIVTKTDRHGVVSVELLTGPTPTGETRFVQVVSGGITAVAETAVAK